jgi:large subunit ribosomal protein L13
MKTYSVKPDEIKREWYTFDASQIPLGRLSTQVAKLLIGKDKAQFSKHIDCGDYVVITNSDKLILTGSKSDDKKYYRHSHYAGGLKETTLKQQLIKDSTEIIYHSIRGMLPVNKLRDQRLARLKIYPTAEHNHAAQKPKTVSLKKEDK